MDFCGLLQILIWRQKKKKIPATETSFWLFQLADSIKMTLNGVFLLSFQS